MHSTNIPCCPPIDACVTPSALRSNNPVRLRARLPLGIAPVEAVRPLELPRPAAAAAVRHRPQQGRPEEAVAVVLGCYSVVSCLAQIIQLLFGKIASETHVVKSWPQGRHLTADLWCIKCHVQGISAP